MSWYEIYLKDIEKKGSLKFYVKDKIKNKKVLIDLIKKYSPRKRIMESGCGTAVLSTYFSSIGYDSTAIDNDDKMLELSNNIAKNYCTNIHPKIIKKSIFDLNYQENYFDVSFSNGVLEHFSDEEIIEALIQQMKIANKVIFGIPTEYFNQEEALYGDERYLSKIYWRNLIKEANGIVLEEKSMHYMNWLNKLFNFRKYFKDYPYRLFVITKKDNIKNI